MRAHPRTSWPRPCRDDGRDRTVGAAVGAAARATPGAAPGTPTRAAIGVAAVRAAVGRHGRRRLAVIAAAVPTIAHLRGRRRRATPGRPPPAAGAAAAPAGVDVAVEPQVPAGARD